MLRSHIAIVHTLRLIISETPVSFYQPIMECARGMGIPEEAITDDILKGVAQGMKLAVQDAINCALKS